MRNQIKLAVIAAITVGGLGFCAAPGFADDARASMSIDKCALPAGVTAKNLGDDTNIREALGDVVAAWVKEKAHHIIEAVYDIDGMKKMAAAK